MSVSTSSVKGARLTLDRAFDALLSEMQREYNPAAEPKKKGWWPWS